MRELVHQFLDLSSRHTLNVISLIVVGKWLLAQQQGIDDNPHCPDIGSVVGGWTFYYIIK